jgi:hypothetical protein
VVNESLSVLNASSASGGKSLTLLQLAFFIMEFRGMAISA